ncbi:MAG: hypothetical protein R6U67_18740 [Sodalinema sp.]|uniref:hypothetical protein n=1 Tax=Sodalinema sp. TaxID=3080550 RepID=UPI0011F89439|nr:MAG: hypothetical protein EYR95_07020 [Phormidium sp. SL48-SHIP]
MMTPQNFADILDSADRLSVEEQEDLIRILQNRLRDRNRADRIRDVNEAQNEFFEGKCSPATPQELMKEILS